MELKYLGSNPVRPLFFNKTMEQNYELIQNRLQKVLRLKPLLVIIKHFQKHNYEKVRVLLLGQSMIFPHLLYFSLFLLLLFTTARACGRWWPSRPVGCWPSRRPRPCSTAWSYPPTHSYHPRHGTSRISSELCYTPTLPLQK